MKAKSTLILFGLVILACVFVIVFTKLKPATRDALQESKLAVSFDSDAVTALTIRKRDSTVRLEKEDDQWRITEPINDRASHLTVTQILTTLEQIPKIDSIRPPKDKEELRDFHRSHSVHDGNEKMQISFEGEDAPADILIGRTTAVGNHIYLRQTDDPTVYVVDESVRAQINLPVSDFRDRQLMDVVPDKIERVVISREDGEIELQREVKEWRITRPIKARADADRVNHLVNSLVGAQIEEFLPLSESNRNEYGLQDSDREVALYVQGETEPADHIVFGEVIESDDEPALYLMSPEREAIYKLPAELEQVVEHHPNDLRDRSLVRFDLDVVDRFRIRPSDQEEMLLIRDQEDWVIESAGVKASANADMVMQFLKDLQTQPVSKFVTDTASSLPRYGLDDPNLEIVLSSYASENVLHGGKGEHPFAHIQFGDRDGGNVYARLEEEPFIVAMPTAYLEEIPTTPAFWRSLDLGLADDASISKFAIETPKADYQFERDEDHNWNRADGEKVENQVQVESFLNALHSLCAVRWVGTGSPEHGLDNPAQIIHYTTNGEEQTLQIGKSTSDGFTYAAFADEAEVFVLPKTTVEALRLPLAFGK